MLALRAQAQIAPAQVSTIEIVGHPHVLSVTGTLAPVTGLQSKFSIYHSAAAAFIDGAAQARQYTDQRALDPAVIALRQKVKVTVDASFRKDQAQAFMMAGGKRYEAIIEHASGMAENPMSDAAIEAKFLANAEPVIGRARALSVVERVWKLDELKDVGELVALCD